MKGEAVPDVADAKLSFDFASPSIPPDYVEEEAQRLEIFRRLAGAGDARDVRAIAGDVRDRFGRPPPAVRRLFRLAELRIACSAAGIARVDVRGARAVFHRDEGGAFARDLAGRTPEEKMDELESMLAPPAPSR
jgi:transcription-repair coupling factor (superfamily II helicase)